MAPEAGQVVVLLRRADAGVGGADDRDVTLAVEREIEPPCGGRPVAHGLDPRDRRGDLHDIGGGEAPVAVDGGKTAERGRGGGEPGGGRAGEGGGGLAEPSVGEGLVAAEPPPRLG